MKRKWNKILAFGLAAALLVASAPVEALARPGSVSRNTKNIVTETETEEEVLTESTASFADSSEDVLITDGEAYINPIYVDVVTEEDITIPDVELSSASSANDGISVASDDETTVYIDSVEEAGAALRAGMKEREASIVIYYYGETYTSDYFKELCTEYIIPEALAETKNADEGDYLRYNYGGTGYRASLTADSNGDYRYYTITFTPTYFTTADQEEEMDETVDALLAGALSFDEDTAAYDKIYAAYDYICSNVTYDNESTTTIKYTAYAALINGTAVCQGYATLYYRLLRELGLNVRVATGYGGVASEDTSNYSENHAWNIVQIDGKWYYADSTWDANFSGVVAAGTYTYQYFLRGTSDFDDVASPYSVSSIHYLIMDSSFTDAYAIEETRYHHYVAVVTEPTCTEGGYTTYTCTLCGDSYAGDEIDACGHTWDEGVVTTEATTTEEGVMTYTCTVCGETTTEAIAVKTISAPSVSLSVSQNSGKIRLTGTITGLDSDDYYDVTGHGFVYITKAKLGAKSLSVNTSGRTKVTVSGYSSDGCSYIYSMTPKNSSTAYVIRAWATYKNSSGKTVYVYSDPVYVSYDSIAE